MNIHEIRNEFEKELIDKGYKFFKDNWRNSLRGIQKKFYDEKGVKYFITGYHYNFKETFPDKQWGEPPYDRYTFETQFRIDKKGKDNTVDISFSGDFLPNEWRPITRLEDIERFFENAFKYLRAEYYELY